MVREVKRACGHVLARSTGREHEEPMVWRCANPRPWWRVLFGMTCVPCEARR